MQNTISCFPIPDKEKLVIQEIQNPGDVSDRAPGVGRIGEKIVDVIKFDIIYSLKIY